MLRLNEKTTPEIKKDMARQATKQADSVFRSNKHHKASFSVSLVSLDEVCNQRSPSHPEMTEIQVAEVSQSEFEFASV